MPFESFSENNINNTQTQPGDNQDGAISNIPVLGSIMKFFTPTTTKLLDKSINSFGYAKQLNQDTSLNPQERGKKAMDYITDTMKLQPKAALELGSYATPLGADSMLVRAGLGGLMGLMKGASEEKSNPASTAISTLAGAGMNAFVPPVMEKGAEALGRTSLGKWGEMLPQIMKESGQKITGSAEQILKTMFEKTEPIRQKMAALMGDLSKTLSTHDIFGAFDQMGNKLDNGIFENAMKDAGTLGRDRATEYLNGLKDRFTQLFNQHLEETGQKSSGMLSTRAMSSSDQQVPLKVWNDLLQDVSNDINWARKTNDPIQKVAKRVYFDLQDEIAKKTGNPAEYARLNKLLQGTSKINESLQSSGKGISGMIGKLKSIGLPIEILASLSSGHPAAAIGGIGTAVATNPKIATNLSALLSNPTSQEMAIKALLNLFKTEQPNESQ